MNVLVAHIFLLGLIVGTGIYKWWALVQCAGGITVALAGLADHIRVIEATPASGATGSDHPTEPRR